MTPDDQLPLLHRLSVDDFIDSFPDAFVALDAQWRFHHANGMAERLLQTSAADMLGRGVWECFPEAVGTTFQLEYERAVREQRPSEFVEFFAPLKRWLSVQAVPLDDGLAIWFQDVTRFKAAEERAMLQARVHEATRTVATAVAAEAPTETLLQLVAERSAELVGADASLVLQFEARETYRVVGRVTPLDLAFPRVGEALPIVAGSEVEHVKRTSRPVAVAEGVQGRHLDVVPRSTVVVPVRRSGEVWGAILVAWHEPQASVESFMPWLTDFAGLIAVALDNAAKRDELASLAATDALTGLANLRELQRHLMAAVARAPRTDRPLTMLLVDIDHFKLVNDGSGHDAGDVVLRRLAGVLGSVRREGDLVARIGGDEFALLLDGATADAGLTVARRISEGLRATAADEAPAVTVSMGCADWQPGLSGEDLQRRADDALYWSKLHGRDQAWAYDLDVIGGGTARHRGLEVRRAGEVADPAELLASVRAAREFWRSALDALSEHVAVLDDRGIVVAVNSAWQDFAEANAASPEAVSPGGDYLAACDGSGDENSRAAAQGVRDILAGRRESFELLYPCHSPDERRWFMLRLGRFAKDGPQRVVVHYENVTRYKLAENRLKFQAQMLDGVDAAVFAVNLDGTIVYANRTAEPLFPRTGGELVGQHVTYGFPAARGEAQLQMLARVIDEGSVEQELQVERPDGESVSMWMRATTLHDSDGEAFAALGVLVDISDKARQAQELAAARDRLAAITASIGEGLLVLTASGVVCDANDAAGSLLAISPGDAIGQVADALLYGSGDHPGVSPGTASDGVVRKDDDVFVRGDATTLPVTWTSAPLDGDAERRGRVVVFRDATSARLREAELLNQTAVMRWTSRIHEALDEDRFVLFAQPIIDLESADVVGEELLIRLGDDHGGFIAPGHFLPAAEQHGLMPAIDAWVVAQAAALAGSGRRVHFNLSGQSIDDAVVTQALIDAAGHADVDPGHMTVELTETALIEETDHVRDFVARLRKLGYTVALDDFGTGYNSFARVRDISVDELKIDMSFVHDMLDNWASESVVRAIVNLAADLGVRTVAEGVEDASTAAKLHELGVNQAQGYHFGRPAIVTGYAASYIPHVVTTRPG